MSIWGKIGEIAREAQEAFSGGTVALAALDIAKAAVDDDDASFQDVVRKRFAENRFTNAQVKAVGWTAERPGIRHVLAGLATGYSYGVARPLSTMTQVTGINPLMPLTGDPLKQLDAFSTDNWREGWKNSATLSPGQAIVASQARMSDKYTPGGDQAQEDLGIKGLSFGEISQVGDPNSPLFNSRFALASGANDALVNWFADPTVVAGKVSKIVRETRNVVRKSDVEALMAPDPTAIKGRRNIRARKTFDGFLEATDGLSPSQLMEAGYFKNNAGLAAVLARASGDHETKRLIMATALQHPGAEAALTARREDIALQMETMHADLDELYFAKELGAVGLLNDPEHIASLEAKVKASQREVDFYDRIIPDYHAARLAEETGTGLPADSLGVVGSGPGTLPKITRADRMRIKSSASFTVQDGVLGVPQRVVYSPREVRPAGRIQLHDAEQMQFEVNAMLRRARNLDPIERQKMLDSVVYAKDDNARRLVIQGIEQKLIRHIGKQLGYGDDIEKILLKMRDERQVIETSFAERSYGVMEDGSTYRSPLTETQLQDSVPTFDIDHTYRVLKDNSERYNTVKKSLGSGFDVLEHGADFLNDLWKFGVLFRGGYPVRNVIDANLRIISHMGALEQVRQLAEMAGVSLRHMKDMNTATTVHNVAETRLRQVEDELRALKESGKPDEALKAELVEERDLRLHEMEVAREIEEMSPRFGQGTINVNGREVADAFGKTKAERDLHHSQITGQDMWGRFLSRGYERGVSKLRTGDFVTKTGADEGWLEDYLRVVNQHFRQSQITQRLLAGESPEEVARWLRSTEGRAVQRRLVHRGDGVEKLVDANVQNLNNALPDPAMRALLMDRPFTADDVQRMFPTAASRPPINGEQIAYSMGLGPVAEKYDQLRNGYFKWVNAMPDDVFGRHPMYRHLYRGRIKQLIESESDDAAFGAARQRVLEEQARKYARHEMKQYMFDVSNKTNLAHFARFISPFYSAWQDTMVKYQRLVVRDPSIMPRAWQVWTAPNDNSFIQVVDSEGNPVEGKDSSISDSEFIVLPAKILGNDSIGQMAIPKAGFNVALQGDPWWLPGFGPFVQAPVNSLANDRPSVADSMEFILPYGAQDAGFASWQTFLPTVAKKLIQGDDDRTYANSKAMILQTEIQRWRDGLRPDKPKEAEINQRAQRFHALQIYTAALSPAAIQYKSPYQFYIDEAHRYADEYGADWKTRYYKKYGEDYFLFTMSLSRNKTGVRASAQADKAALRVKDLIADNPDYGWFFVGPDNVGDYNRNAYVAQGRRKVSPLSSETYRSFEDPLHGLADNNAEIGWIQYQALTAKLEAIRVSRGLRSMQVKGAEDLRHIKDVWLAKVKDPENGPGWGRDWLNDYESRDEGTIRKFLGAAKTAVEDSRINTRSDIATMAVYLHHREQIRAVLQARKAAGGSASLTAQTNGDLAQIWQLVTGRLIEQDITFGDTFARLLERDDLTAGI